MSRNTLTIARGVAAIGATVALMVGATFASLTSNPVTLSNNSISSATASLKVWNGSTFATDAQGLQVSNLLPGSDSSAFHFYLANDGTADLNVTLVSSSEATTNVDANKVHLIFTNDHTNDIQSYTLHQLASVGGALPGNPLHAGATGNSGVSGTEGNFTVVVHLDADAVTGQGGTVSPFTLTFTGTQL